MDKQCSKNRKRQEKADREWARMRAVYQRRAAVEKACEGLTTEELKALNPDLLRAAPALNEALKDVGIYLAINYTDDLTLNSKVAQIKELLAKAEVNND